MATLAHVAQKAGVSVAAASFVLGAARSNMGVGPATRARILQAARDLKYRRNPLAASFRTGKTYNIGVCMGNARSFLTHPEGAFRFWALSDAAAEMGYRVSPVGLRAHGQTDPRLMDGCVVLSVLDDDLRPEMERFAAQIPVLAVHGDLPGGIRVLEDTSWMLKRRLAAEYLFDMGHRAVAVAYLRSAGAQADVSEIFRDVALERGLEATVHPLGEKTLTIAFRSIEAMWDLRPFPTAVFAVDDHYAHTLITRLARRRLRVPEDVSVFSGNTHPDPHAFAPQLTGLCLHYEEVQAELTRKFLDIVEGRSAAREIALRSAKVALIERESCAPPRP